jgi:hypothetical protein
MRYPNRASSKTTDVHDPTGLESTAVGPQPLQAPLVAYWQVHLERLNRSLAVPPYQRVPPCLATWRTVSLATS